MLKPNVPKLSLPAAPPKRYHIDMEPTTKRKPKTTKFSPAIRKKHERFAKQFALHGNATLAAIEAGYAPTNAANTGSRLANDVDLQKRIDAYGQLGLDTLAAIAYSGKVEVARVQAAKELVERAYGKAKSNPADTKRMPDITLVFNRVDSSNANTLETGQTVVTVDGNQLAGDAAVDA